jgi:YggT family protein
MIAGLIDLVFKLFELLILARVLLSWVQLDPSNPIVRFIYQTTEPVLRPVRQLMPQGMPFDFSPMIVLIAAFILEGILLQIF